MFIVRSLIKFPFHIAKMVPRLVVNLVGVYLLKVNIDWYQIGFLFFFEVQYQLAIYKSLFADISITRTLYKISISRWLFTFAGV